MCTLYIDIDTDSLDSRVRTKVYECFVKQIESNRLFAPKFGGGTKACSHPVAKNTRATVVIYIYIHFS